MTTRKFNAGMRGQVRAMNPACGMAAIQTPEGFTIIELTGDDVELGDVVAWDDATALGNETYYNITKGAVIEVFVQAQGAPETGLRTLLLLESA